MHAQSRIQPLRRIVPSSAADYPCRATIGSFRVSHLSPHEAVREPIRYPLRGIAREILRAVRALTRGAAVHRRKTSFVRIRSGFAEISKRRIRLIIAPRISAAVGAPRG